MLSLSIDVVYSANNPQHWLFQLANVFLFLSYVIPSILALRLLLACAGLSFLLWGWLVLPFSIDTVIWNGVFLLVNLTQACLILWRRRPVHLDSDREFLYTSFFAPGKGHVLSRADFKALSAEQTTHQQQHGKHNKHKQLTKQQPSAAVADEEAGVGVVAVIPEGGGAFLSSSASQKTTTTTTTTTADGAHPPPPRTLHRRRGSFGSSSDASASPLSFVREYKHGECIARVGQQSEWLSIILRGQVVVEAAVDPDDDQIVQAHAQAGSSCHLNGAAQPQQLANGASVAPGPSSSSAATATFRPVALLQSLDFLDSPEWVARQSARAPVFSVQLRVHSLGGARVFHWRASALDAFLSSRPDIQGAVLGVVGVDLARKVFAANVDRHELEAELRAHKGGAVEPETEEAAETDQAAAVERTFHMKSPEIPLSLQRKASLLQKQKKQQQQQQQQLKQAPDGGATLSVLPSSPMLSVPAADVGSPSPVPSDAPSPSSSPSPSPSPSSSAVAAAQLQPSQALVSLLALVRGAGGGEAANAASMALAQTASAAGGSPPPAPNSLAASNMNHEHWCAMKGCTCTCNQLPPARAAAAFGDAAEPATTVGIATATASAHDAVRTFASDAALAAPSAAVIDAVANDGTYVVHIDPHEE